MVSSSKFYSDIRLSLMDVVKVIKDEFGVEDITLPHHDDYGYIYFFINNESHYVFFSRQCYISGGERNGTDNSSLSSSSDDKGVSILRRLGAYFGGVLEPNDCSDIPPNEYITPSKVKEVGITIEMRLYSLLMNNKLKNNIEIVNFIINNREEILKIIQ